MLNMVKTICPSAIVLATLACAGERATAPSAAATSALAWSLAGRVTGGSIFTSEGTSSPVGGATLSIIDGPDAGKAATTDALGNYTFSGLQQSGFTVSASAAGYVSQSRGVTLTSNQTLNFTLTKPAPAVTLAGRVTDALTSIPISGAHVSINGRYGALTDPAGNYSVAGVLDAGANSDFTYVSANGYASDYRHIRGVTQNIHLYRLERTTAGNSTLVTIAPDDTLCVNNVQDEPGIGPDYVCRSVIVTAAVNGMMIVEAVSTADGTYPPLEVEIHSNPVDFQLRNPTPPFQVTAGTDVVVSVEMLASAAVSQSFALKTSVSPP